NVGYAQMLVAREKNAGADSPELRAAEGRTIRKAVYLDKLLNLSVLNKDTVLEAYTKAEERILTSPGKPSDRARARLEAYADLTKELKLTPPPFGLAHAAPDPQPKGDLRIRTIR